MARREKGKTRAEILSVADKLFYSRGIKEVSLDDIAAGANVTKKTVYYYFASKEKLVAAYLEQRDEVTLQWLISAADTGGEKPAQKITALFEALKNWSTTSQFHGCPFVRAASDLIKVPTHEALTVGPSHKQKYQNWLVELAQSASTRDPETVGRQLLVLIDGAIAETLVTQDSSFFDVAEAIAIRLLAADQ